jgi:LacI family transcriptional regulator/LacI family repressor for deo operon, udp, cdd, tsx, nupC, and nupG
MPIGKIISYAIDLAVAMARDPGTGREPSLQVFTPELIVRESTAPPPRARAPRR